MSPRPSDHEIRHEIVTDIERSCFVEASAGTGKTRLMVERILEIVETGAAELDRIAAITFTEKAAGELRVRIRDAIGQRLESQCGADGEPLDATRLERLREAEGRLDRATVSTIHSFCTQILKERPIEAGVTPGYGVADDVQARLLFEEAFEEWITEELTRLDSPLGPVLEAGVRPCHLAELASDMLGHRDLLTDLDAVLPAPPEDSEVAWKSYSTAVATLTANLDRLLLDCREPNTDLAFAAMNKGRNQLELLVRQTAPGSTVPRSRLLDDPVLPKIGRSGRKGEWVGDSLAELRTLVAGIRAAHEAWVAVYRSAMTLLAVRCLGGALEAYERKKAERSQLDFDDLLLRTRDLLRTDAVARRDLAENWTRILVDEFQDTDPVQVEIVTRLAALVTPDDSGGPPRPGPGRLFVVGDPKQSIYRFRRADIQMYTRTVKELEAAGGKLRVITENFRTRPSITTWVNRLFERLMPPGEADAHQPPYSHLTPFRSDPIGAPGGVLRLDINGIAPVLPGGKPKNWNATARRRLEAEAVAAQLVRVMSADGWRVVDRDTAAERPARWSDVAILFRTFTPLEAYEAALRAAEIPFRVEGGRYYFKRIEVQALLATLRAIDDPLDRVAMIASLRSPLFGFTDDELLIGAEAGLFDPGTDSGGAPPGLARAVEQIRAWHGRRHSEGPTRITLSVLDATSAVELFVLMPLGEQRVANLMKIVDEARTFESHAGGFRRFIRYLSEREATLEKERDSPGVEDDAEGAITIQSMHGSKGLEYPIVVLVDLDGQLSLSKSRSLMSRDANGKARLGFRLAGLKGHQGTTPGWTELEADEKRHSEAELRRLFYVATTRARDWLILPIVTLTGKPSGLRALLTDADLDDLPSVDSSPGGPSLCEPLFRRGWRVPAPTDPLAQPVAAEVERAREAYLSRRRALMASWPRAVRRLNPSTHIGRTATFDAPSTIGPTFDGRPVGRAVHAALERVAADGTDRARQVARAVRDEGILHPEEARRVARLVDVALSLPIWARAVRSSRLIREAPLLAGFPPAELNDAPIRIDGICDLLFEEASGVIVVDWKTDQPGPHGWDEVARRHQPQMLAYLLAIEAAMPLPVTELNLVFLEGGATETIQVDDALRQEARRIHLAPDQPI